MISVPDLATLSKLFLNPTYPDALHWSIIGMIFGGQKDDYDYHVVCNSKINNIYEYKYNLF